MSYVKKSILYNSTLIVINFFNDFFSTLTGNQNLLVYGLVYPLMKTSIINWGILGCGDVCEIKSGPGFYKALSPEKFVLDHPVQNSLMLEREKTSNLIAVMRRNETAVKDFAKRHQVEKWYTDAEALLQNPDIHAVYIATPPGNHMELVELCARFNKPCLVEKPIARNAVEGEKMKEIFDAIKIPCYVAYYRRHLTKFQLIKSILERFDGQIVKSLIGDINGLVIKCCHDGQLIEDEDINNQNWRISNVESSGGGIFVDMGSHQLDLVDFFFGPLPLNKIHGLAINSYYKRQKEKKNIIYPEDQVRMTFETEQGYSGIGEYNFATDIKEDLFQIRGSHGCLEFECFNTKSPIIYKRGGKWINQKDSQTTTTAIEKVEINNAMDIHEAIQLNTRIQGSSLFDNPEQEGEILMFLERLNLDIEEQHKPHVHQRMIESINEELLFFYNYCDMNVNDFHDKIRTERDVDPNNTCYTTFESAIRTSKVIDTVLSTYYNGREDKFWERPSTWQI